jgi:DNA-binding NtrC family response regulator
VHGIVKGAEGRIEIQSELGHGTTFEIYLPAIDAAAQKIDSLVAAGALGVETIMFVEDDMHVRESASRALRSRGFAVVEASDGKAALELLRDHADGIDLLVTDVVMPGMDGRQLVDAARSERPALRVLYTSGYTDDAIVRHGVIDTEVAFLEKPYSVDRLAGKVRQVLDAA